MKKTSVILILFLMLPAFFTNAQQEERIKLNMSFSEDMMFQPVDIHVKFERPCAAIDEKTHSISVLFKGREIESQIYDLQFGIDGMLTSCNLVYLYQGHGDYTITYGNEVRTIAYKDHINVSESYYSVEPLPGFSTNLRYYSIEEDERVLFGICQEGNILNIDMGNKIIKVRDDANIFEMQNWAQIFSFALFHSDGTETGSDERIIGKSILVDGNLMTKIAIETISADNLLRTKAIYTYYYSPAPEKRMFIRLQHKASNEWEGNATYSYIMFIKARSKTIDEFNMGDIYPYTHFNGENGIEEYSIDVNPDTKDFRWIISSADGVTLGNPPWIGVDNKNRTYTFIFSQQNLTVSAGVKQEIGVPGLEIDGGGISLGERGQINAGTLFDGTIELYVGDYANIQREVSAFFQFEPYRISGATNDFEDICPRYNLTVKTFGRSAVPFSTYVSALLGVPLPSLEIEIWNNSLVAKNTVNFRKTSFILPEGSYMVKIFHNTSRERKFIGAHIIVLNKDTNLRVGCTFQTSFFINAPENSIIRVLKDHGVIAQYSCNGTELRIPIPALNTYTLQVIYKGFLMAEESIFAVLPTHHRTFSFDTYAFQLSLKDKLGLSVAVTPTISMESDEMYEPTLILPSKVGENYQFNALPAERYTIMIRFKGFMLEHKLSIPETTSLELVFPAEYEIFVKTYDKRGFPIKTDISFERENQCFTSSILPPADYKIKAYVGKQTVAMRTISLTTDSSYEMVTSKAQWYPYILPVILALLFMWRQKIPILCALLLSLSFLFSWWTLSGDTTTYLYLILPGMIEMGPAYGTVLSLPSLMQIALCATLSLLVLTIVMMCIKYLAKFSLIPLVCALATFVATLFVFSDITVGGFFGSSIVDGVRSTWGPGLGFYLAVFSLVLLIVHLLVSMIKLRKVA